MIQTYCKGQAFLSTPSARRATGGAHPQCFAQQFLSTPSARRATLDLWGLALTVVISIHALREEGDSADLK